VTLQFCFVHALGKLNHEENMPALQAEPSNVFYIVEDWFGSLQMAMKTFFWPHIQLQSGYTLTIVYQHWPQVTWLRS